MLGVIKEIFEKESIEVDDAGNRTPLHSHTSVEQGNFIQEIFDLVQPVQSLEVGLAYGISTLFILEKVRELGKVSGMHIAIEPDSYWGGAALHNIKKEGLEAFLRIEKDFSDKVLPRLYSDGVRIQYAYIDTTKLFDVVMQDVYFISRMLDVGGVIILDDCGGGWPGIQRVARFVNTLPHFKKLKGHNRIVQTKKKALANSFVSGIINILPFKSRLLPTMGIKPDKALGLDFSCLAFSKVAEDTREWSWDKTF